MAEPLSGPSPSTIDSRGATSVGIASVVAGVSGLLVIMLVPRIFSTEDQATFLTFWSLLFAVFGVIGGVQNETTRAVRSATTATVPRGAPRVVPVGLGIGLVLAVVVAATSPVWSPALFDAYRPGLVGVVTVAVLLFSGHSAVAGALSGRGSWATYSTLVASEASVRLLLVVVTWALGLELFGAEAATGAAAGVWLLVVLLRRDARASLDARADVTLAPLLRHTGHAMIAAASSATIVVGFPVALRLTTDPLVYAQAAPLILAITLTRAPLLMPLNAYQGVAIAHFLDNRHRGPAVLLRLGAMVMGVAVVGAGLAAVVGPWIMRTVTTHEVQGWVLACLTLDAGLLALVTLTGAAVLALGRHAAYATGWFVASAVTVATLFFPASIEVRTVLALTAGPVAGLVVHLSQVAAAARADR